MRLLESYPVTAEDYRARARRRLPRFLFDYVDGGAGAEQTLAANVDDWARLRLRQRVLLDVDGVDVSGSLLGAPCTMPVALAPVGFAGMMARRGEAQAARAAQAAGLPFTLSTVGICSFDEVKAAAGGPTWFQLYMLRDRGLVAALLDQVWAAGCRSLVFTVDLPVLGPRHRDPRHGIGQPGLRPKLIKLAQLLTRPHWLRQVAIGGKPHSFGSLGDQVPAARDFETFRTWVDTQFDPTVGWADIDWLRARWPGRLALKGLLDRDDVAPALASGADALIVSNHGGRQLDGAPSTARVLPAIAKAVNKRCELLVDGGIRSGIDVFRALALGADGVMIGRPWVWALAAAGEPGLRALIDSWQRELRTTMALAGVKRIADIGPQHLQSE
jgi:L-lactate dehydrogenase (cytochrome)